MKRTVFTLAAIAGAAVSAPTPTPAPAAAPAPVIAPAAIAAPEPTPVAAPAAPSTGSPAPYAPVTDALLQNNPAAQGSISSVLSIPHRWAEKRVAVFQWSGDALSNSSGLAYGTMDNIFAGFQANSTRGDFTAGYTTPLWGAGLKVNFGKRWRTTSDSIDHVYQDNKESSATYAADGIELIGSYNMDPFHIYGALVWRTLDTSETWQEANGDERNDYSSRYDRIGLRLGIRTYVTGAEGFAWRVNGSIYERYLRPSGSELAPADSEFEKSEVYEFGLAGDAGYRFATANKSMLNVGVNTAFNMINGKPEPVNNAVVNRYDYTDYNWSISARPNASILLPMTERWTLLGGAGLTFSYTASDAYVGDDEAKISTLTTTAPSGNFGFRYGKDIWAIEAQVSSDLLTNGPYFITGRDGTSTDDQGNYVLGGPVLAQFGLTVNLK